MIIKVIGTKYDDGFQGFNPLCFLLDENVLFDAGNLINTLNERELSKIKNIFVTHAHLDHIKDIAFLIENIVIERKKQKINILGISPVIKTISKNLFNDLLWPDFTKIPDKSNPILNYITLKEGLTFKIDSYNIIPYRMNHTVSASGYLVENNKNKRFFYTGDSGPTDNVWKKINNKFINVLIIDVSFPNKMSEIAVKTGHLTPKLLKNELQKIKHMPERIYIFHPKSRYRNIIKNELSILGIGNIILLNGGERIKI